VANSYRRLLSSFLKLFFSLLYHQFAGCYDLVAWLVSLGRWQSWVRFALPYLEGPRILELGHGPGHLQEELHRAGKNPFGIDESWSMNRLAGKRISRASYQAQLVLAYAQALPFRDQSFDQAVATFPSEYIFEEATIAQIHRLLLPGGRLIVIPAAWITGASLLDRLAAGLFRLTQQAPPIRDSEYLAKACAPFQHAGFKVDVVMHKSVASEVMILIASKLSA